MKASGIVFRKSKKKPYTNQQTSEIQAILKSLPRKPGYRPPPDFSDPLKEVKYAVEWFLAFRKRDYPRYSERKRTLERFSNWCSKAIKNREYLKEVESFLSEDPAAFTAAGINLMELEDLFFLQHEENRKETRSKLAHFLLLAQNELRDMPRDRGGSNVNVARREFILRLAQIAEEFTGKPKGTGLASRRIIDEDDNPEGYRRCPFNDEPMTWERCHRLQLQGNIYECPKCPYRDLRPSPKESKTEYYGEFFNLVNACLDPVDSGWKRKSNNARGGEIQRSLGYVTPRLKRFV